MDKQNIPALMKVVMRAFDYVEENIKKNYAENPQAAAKARDNAAKLQQEIMNKVTNGEIADVQELRYALKSIMDRNLKRYPAKIPEHCLGITQTWEGGMPKIMFDLPIYVKGGYKIAPDGVFKKADSKDTEYREQLCSHAFIPIQRFISLQKKPESYQVVFNRDGRWKSFVITANEMLSSNGLQKYTSEGIIISEDQARPMVKFCRKFLEADLIKTITYTSSRLGWHDGEFGRGEFVPYSQKVILDPVGSELGEQLQTVNPTGSMDAWLKMVKPLWESSAPFCMFLAAAAAAPIVGRVKGNTFVVELYGPTGVGKTICLEIAASMFGKPSQDGLMFVMNSTNNYFSKALSALNNLPMCIDENEVRKSAARNKYQPNPENELLYIICSNKGRTRLSSESKADPVDIWNTVVLVTGEQPMTTIGTSQGAKNRIIEVELEYLEADFYSIDKTLRHNYGLIGPLIIEKLKAMKDVDDELKARADRLLAARSNVSGKMVNYGAACLLAYDILQEIFGEGSLTDRGVAGYLKSKGDINNTDDAYKHIIGWVTTMSKNFEWGSGYEPPAGVTRPSDWSSYHEIYGTMHDGYVTIKRDELNKELMATFSRDMKTFQRDMAARDYIRVQRDKQGKVTAYFNTQSVNGERLDCFRVNMNVEIPKEENGNA